MSYATLEEAMAATPQERIATDGRPELGGSCLWHRQHQHYLEHVVPFYPACRCCGGPVDPRSAEPVHNLCLALSEAGLPVTRLDATRHCPCQNCLEGK